MKDAWVSFGALGGAALLSIGLVKLFSYVLFDGINLNSGVVFVGAAILSLIPIFVALFVLLNKR